jgi:DNA polymerase-3 subunit alpha
VSEKTAVKPKFVHLHNHSHYSLLDGLQKVPGMLERVQELGMDAVALTDHGTLSGAIEFYKSAKKMDIKPIIGVETYVAPRGHLDKAGRQDANPYHLILLAENNVGYHNLMRLVSIAQLDGYYYKPRVDRALLAKYHEGLIALSGCLGGEVGTNIENNNLAEAEAVIRWYDQTFGHGNYFLELQAHEHQFELQKKANTALIELSRKTGVPMVVTADSHYSVPSEREAHEVLLCVQTVKELSDPNRMSMEMELAISSPDELAERFAHVPEALANTVKIAERCQVDIELGRILIPTFDVPPGFAGEREYLHHLCWQGLAWRYGGIPKEDISHITEDKARGLVDKSIVERLEFELAVIGRMGYDGYFLITADFINWGKNQGIIFGPGRGSAAGSIVAYAMNITDLDPIKYDLLFERFLNPDRVSMPDIDIDIQDTRRGEVIDYVTEKYGQERVAQIITFGTMAARNSVRDTGRVLGYPYEEVDRIAKLVPMPVQGRHVPLAVSVGLIEGKGEQKADAELVTEYTNNPRAQQLIDLAMRLEGTIRSNGVHAAGVVIAPEAIVNFAPLQRAQKGGISTQYEMHAVEELGLLKMDFLGLSNLTIINNTLRIIRKVYGQSLEIATIPLDDKTTFDLLSRGDTTGVFQVESAGMKRYLRELKPTVFDDVISMVALYRPGPIQWIDDFIERKHGRRKIEYLHPAMENALKSTYGVMVTQEQVMQISKEMCGFTGGQADTLRKAIGKKDPKLMAKIKSDFIEGAIKTVGADQKLMETLWEQLEAFAAYCFNKAHSACYALIAYQTAYLKAHYPAAFMAALLTSDFGNTDRIAIEVAECQRMGLTVLPPDVNQSFLEFAVVKDTDQIRFGLSAVKNVGTAPIEAILAARQEGGPFSSVEDFAKRVNAGVCNKKVWESLAKAGAFDSFLSGDRGLLLNNLDLVTAYAAKAQKNALSGQIDIFGSLGADEDQPALRLDPPPAPVSHREQLSWERELLGLYLSHHPLDDYAAYLADTCQSISTLTPDADGKVARVGGLVTSVRKITTKTGSTMAFVGLEDKSGVTELVVFPKAYEKSPQVYEPDNVIAAQGKVSARDREGRLTAEPKVMVDAAKIIDYDLARAHRPLHGAPVSPAGNPPAAKTEPARPPHPKTTTPSDASPRVVQPAPAPAAPKTAAAPGVLILKLADLTNDQLLHDIKKILSAHSGQAEAFVLLGADSPKKIRLPFRVAISDELVAKLGELLGQGQVVKSD